MDKLIITAALVGAEVTREDTPHLPVTPEEIGQAAAEAREAGASIAHIHVRDADGKPSQDRELYRRAIEEIRKRCDIIIQVSTGGAVGMTAEERLQPVALRPEMATLTTGTVNFGDGVFLNPPREIEHFAKVMQEYGVRPEFEIFDVGMIRNALSLVKKGLVTGHLHFDFVMGVPGGIPATAENLLHLLRQLPEGATWTVAGVGRALPGRLWLALTARLDTASPWDGEVEVVPLDLVDAVLGPEEGVVVSPDCPVAPELLD